MSKKRRFIVLKDVDLFNRTYCSKTSGRKITSRRAVIARKRQIENGIIRRLLVKNRTKKYISHNKTYV